MELANAIAASFSAICSVDAVVLAGSQTAGSPDQRSDIDLYVYSNEPVSLIDRERIAKTFSRDPEVGNAFWEPGDEWIDPESKIGVDVMFRNKGWIESQLDQILKQHLASVGYSTCFWHNVLTSAILFDKNEWFANLKTSAQVPYPDELRKAIVAKNYPILRNTQSSYSAQIARAIERSDPVSIQHRITAFLASYFDILFAINRVPHPGEKRLVVFVEEKCGLKPENFSKKILHLLNCNDQQIVSLIDSLVDDLDELITQRREGANE